MEKKLNKAKAKPLFREFETKEHKSSHKKTSLVKKKSPAVVVAVKKPKKKTK